MRDEKFYQDLMNRVLNRREFNRYKNIDVEKIEWMEESIPAKQELLTDHDKMLLDKYAPKLFDVVYSAREAYRAMLGLVQAFYCLRYDKSSYSIPNDAQTRPPTYKKQSLEFKSKKLQEKTVKAIPKLEKIFEPILGLMGGDDFHTSKSCQFKEAYKYLMEYLSDASKIPPEYVPHISKKQTSKEPVREYLKGLNLGNKGKIIESFLTQIK